MSPGRLLTVLEVTLLERIQGVFYTGSWSSYLGSGERGLCSVLSSLLAVSELPEPELTPEEEWSTREGGAVEEPLRWWEIGGGGGGGGVFGMCVVLFRGWLWYLFGICWMVDVVMVWYSN